MKINKSINDSILKIELEGRLDTTTAPELEKCVEESINDVNKVVFDFANLQYISSAGLRVLLATKKACKTGDVKIINANETIKEVFEITGFVDILSID